VSYFQYRDGVLHVEDITLTAIACAEGTPFYVYSAEALRHNFRVFCDAFKGMDIFIAYALKANSNQAILTLLRKEGAGADVVSEGDMRRALAAEISAKKIVYSGVGKTVDEINFALSQNIYCFNVESETELIQLSQQAVAVGKKAPTSLRINPDVDAKTHKKILTGRSESKFGIPLSRAHDAYRLAASLPGIRICGVDVHIGSQICELLPFETAFAIMARFVDELRQMGHTISHVDIGGGLGISYDFDSSSLPSSADYAATVQKYMGSLNVKLIAEPGRMIVGNSGMLVTSVIHVKKGADKNFIIVDAGMNDLIRPTLYDAWHTIIPVDEAKQNKTLIFADIVGPICETGDYLGLARRLPKPVPGELLAITNAGAYGAVMSNTYNTRLLVPEILVEGRRYDVIRPRPSYEDLIGLDKVPNWL